MDAGLQELLEPISNDLPAGEDLSFSAEFDRIQEARREDDPTVDYGEWQTTLKQADWRKVAECCTAALRTHSKDLRLAAWLTEGLTKTNGIAGLADGVELTARLIERFGNDIHPQAEEGDQEQRIGTLTWFVMRMSQLARQIPITRAAVGQFSLIDYEAAQHLQAQLLRNPDQGGETEDRLTLERFSAAVAKTEKALYGQWIADAERCELALSALTDASDRLFGDDGPSYAQLAGSLGAIHQRLRMIANDLGLFATESAAGTASGVPAVEPVEMRAPAVNQGQITTRAQAIEALRQVAIYFRNTEPHSPVAYLADKAARWGAMPLHAWLRTVVKDHGTLSHIEELLGLEVEPEKE